MLRWMSVVTRKDRLGNKYIKRKSTGGRRPHWKRDSRDAISDGLATQTEDKKRLAQNIEVITNSNNQGKIKRETNKCQSKAVMIFPHCWFHNSTHQPKPMKTKGLSNHYTVNACMFTQQQNPAQGQCISEQQNKNPYDRVYIPLGSIPIHHQSTGFITRTPLLSVSTGSFLMIPIPQFQNSF